MNQRIQNIPFDIDTSGDNNRESVENGCSSSRPLITSAKEAFSIEQKQSRDNHVKATLSLGDKYEVGLESGENTLPDNRQDQGTQTLAAIVAEDGVISVNSFQCTSRQNCHMRIEVGVRLPGNRSLTPGLAELDRTSRSQFDKLLAVRGKAFITDLRGFRISSIRLNRECAIQLFQAINQKLCSIVLQPCHRGEDQAFVLKVAFSNYVRCLNGQSSAILSKFSFERCSDLYQKFVEALFVREHATETENTSHILYRCSVIGCRKLSIGYAQAIRHARKHAEMDPTEYACDCCGKVFAGIAGIKRHLLTHMIAQTEILSRDNVTSQSLATRESYDCDVCLKSMWDLSSLRKHKYRHIDTNYECRKCSYKCNCRSKLQRHMKYHNKDKAYTCDVCKHRFFLKEHLARHIVASHKVQAIDDAAADMYAIASDVESALIHDLLNNIESLESGLARNDCGQAMEALVESIEKSLASHKLTYVIRSRTVYGCEVCERKFATINLLQYNDHQLMHRHTSSCGLQSGANGDQTLIYDTATQQQIGNRRLFDCGFCPFIASDVETLSRHLKSVHIPSSRLAIPVLLSQTLLKAVNDGEIRLICGHCSFDCTSFSRFETHLTQRHRFNVTLVEPDKETDLVEQVISKQRGELICLLPKPSLDGFVELMPFYPSVIGRVTEVEIVSNPQLPLGPSHAKSKNKQSNRPGCDNEDDSDRYCELTTVMSDHERYLESVIKQMLQGQPIAGNLIHEQDCGVERHLIDFIQAITDVLSSTTDCVVGLHP